jgi:hypothetical protein
VGWLLTISKERGLLDFNETKIITLVISEAMLADASDVCIHYNQYNKQSNAERH